MIKSSRFPREAAGRYTQFFIEIDNRCETIGARSKFVTRDGVDGRNSTSTEWTWIADDDVCENELLIQRSS